MKNELITPTSKALSETGSKNVVNGVICSMAKVERETEKAIQLTFIAEIYGEDFTIKKQWFPKSQLTIHKHQDGIVWFTAKNDWIIDRKVKDYCKYVADTFSNIKHEIMTYLSPINSEVIKQVFA